MNLYIEFGTWFGAMRSCGHWCEIRGPHQTGSDPAIIRNAWWSPNGEQCCVCAYYRDIWRCRICRGAAP